MNIHPCVILVITIRMSLPIITSIMNTLKVTSCGFFFGLEKFKTSTLLKVAFTPGVRDSSVVPSHHHVNHLGLKPTYHENFMLS